MSNAMLGQRSEKYIANNDFHLEICKTIIMYVKVRLRIGKKLKISAYHSG